MDQRKYSDKEYSQLFMYAMTNGNLQAAAEVRDHERLFGKEVKVVKGRKVPVGTVGKVVYLARKCYGSQWDWDTRLGIEDESGNRHYTSALNVEII